MPLLPVVPFVVLLLAIAIAPLLAPRWWHSNRNKALVVLVLSLPIVIHLWGTPVLTEKVEEYAGFIVVIGALFMIAGGIHIQGSLSNTALLGIGAVLANLFGTTGASVLLIRPLLRANRGRKRTVHTVIFFTFIVANCGGLLTPIGDPPLLLGFLNGVPFAWTLRLWPQWLFVNGILLALYYLWERLSGDQVESAHEPLRVRGAVELVALAGVIVTIIMNWSLLLVLLFAVIAYFLGSRERRTSNLFTFVPLVEVAVLFAGIFVTMAPALEILNARSAQFGLSTPAQFFWATGALSSVLDNAPTYLAFTATAAGLQGIAPHGAYIAGIEPKILAAISTGAVFMGANTYIGNAPNFMIRAIAQENGVPMPSFFGYMAYSIGILVPLFVAVSLLFF